MALLVDRSVWIGNPFGSTGMIPFKGNMWVSDKQFFAFTQFGF